jgi:tetratricopeptide (TPR) repeat protein
MLARRKDGRLVTSTVIPQGAKMKNNRIVICLIMIFLLSGCAAMGVPETNDPIEKLKWADELYDQQGRPLPAERLINEAIEICKRNNDLSCLGRAYLSYGFFFRAPSVEKWQKYYKENGFYDRTAAYENRLMKSKEYFEAAISKFMETKEYDALTNAYLNLGFTYYFMGDHNSECEPYAKSLEFYLKNIETNPDANVALPPGFSSYKEYIRVQQERAGCL